MANYKIIFDGSEQDEVFGTYEDAKQYAAYLISCCREGGKIFEMSNPGDYPYDPDDEPEYEIIETDEEEEELDDEMKRFNEIVNSQGVFDEYGEYVRCRNCGYGLHYYKGVKTCPKCGPVE
ncbi:MAG: hypothetical protein K6G88_04540 [Lachnospiraceae bacterium]|nr:hypothetical protein [Lachnospiraceae bacterium]